MRASKILGASLVLSLSFCLTACKDSRREVEQAVSKAAAEEVAKQIDKAATEMKAQALRQAEEAKQKAIDDAKAEVAKQTELAKAELTKQADEVKNSITSQAADVTKDIKSKLVVPKITNEQSQKDLSEIFSSTERSLKQLNNFKQLPAAIDSPFKPIAYEVPQSSKATAIVIPAPKKTEIKPVISEPGLKLPTLPPNAVPLIPLLRKTTDMLWPDIPYRSFMASKIEQESCVSLTSKKCWSPYAELKTKREYGFGFGQTTIAYKADGVTERFNVWKELRSLDPELKEKWTWENRFDAEMQIRALLIKSKMSHHAIRFPVANEYEHMAFGAVTYNSGSVLVDRKICISTPGCDPSRWFGNVEKYSSKAKVAAPGYGKSFYEISREYPRNVLNVRRPKYIPYLDI